MDRKGSLTIFLAFSEFFTHWLFYMRMQLAAAVRHNLFLLPTQPIGKEWCTLIKVANPQSDPEYNVVRAAFVVDASLGPVNPSHELTGITGPCTLVCILLVTQNGITRCIDIAFLCSRFSIEAFLSLIYVPDRSFHNISRDPSLFYEKSLDYCHLRRQGSISSASFCCSFKC